MYSGLALVNTLVYQEDFEAFLVKLGHFQIPAHYFFRQPIEPKVTVELEIKPKSKNCYKCSLNNLYDWRSLCNIHKEYLVAGLRR